MRRERRQLGDVGEAVVPEVEVAERGAAGLGDGGEGGGPREAVVGEERRRSAGRRGRPASEERRAPATESSSRTGSGRGATARRRPVVDLTAPSRVRVLGRRRGVLDGRRDGALPRGVVLSGAAASAMARGGGGGDAGTQNPS